MMFQLIIIPRISIPEKYQTSYIIQIKKDNDCISEWHGSVASWYRGYSVSLSPGRAGFESWSGHTKDLKRMGPVAFPLIAQRKGLEQGRTSGRQAIGMVMYTNSPTPLPTQERLSLVFCTWWRFTADNCCTSARQKIYKSPTGSSCEDSMVTGLLSESPYHSMQVLTTGLSTQSGTFFGIHFLVYRLLHL